MEVLYLFRDNRLNLGGEDSLVFLATSILPIYVEPRRKRFMMKTGPIRISYIIYNLDSVGEFSFKSQCAWNSNPKIKPSKGKVILHNLRCVIFLWKFPYLFFSFWGGGACNLSKTRLGCNLSKNYSEWLFIPLPWKFHRLVLGQYTWGVEGISGYLCEVCLAHRTWICLRCLEKINNNILPYGWFNGDFPWYVGEKSPKKTNPREPWQQYTMYLYLCIRTWHDLYFFCPPCFSVSLIFHTKNSEKNSEKTKLTASPRYSLYGIFTYIWMVFGGI